MEEEFISEAVYDKVRGMIRTYSRRVDLDGNKIEKNPEDYPYSYDMYVTYRAGKNEEMNNSAYSDRMLQWDYDLTRELMLKHFGGDGDYWNDRKPKDIEAFLRERFKKPNLKLIVVCTGCNVSNGYPYWYFGFNEGEVK